MYECKNDEIFKFFWKMVVGNEEFSYSLSCKRDYQMFLFFFFFQILELKENN